MAIKICNNVVIPNLTGVNASQNAAFGIGSLQNLSSGTGNTASGYNSGCAITSGSNNTVIGSLVGSAGLTCTVLIGAGTCERIKVDDTGLYINGGLIPSSKYTGTIGDGSSTEISVTHNLNKSYIMTDVVEVSTGIRVYPDVTHTTTNSTKFTFVSAPTTNQYEVMLVGVA